MERLDARAFATALGLFVVAVSIRALPWGEVFTEEGVRFIGTDPYFHMRAIAWTVEHFPALQTFDPYIQYPDGARPIVAPLFDWMLALFAWPFVDDVSGDGLERLERFAVWVPPLLGGLAVVVTWGTARRHFGASVALVAGGLLAITSGHFWYSRLGLVDHHVAVALLAVAQLALALRLLRPREGAEDGIRFGMATALGAAIAAAFLVWPGSLLHLALIDGPLVVHAISRDLRSASCAHALEIALAHGAAAAFVIPFAWGNEWTHLGPFSPVVLSEFQPWALASVGISLAFAAVAWKNDRLGETPAVRLGTVVAGGVLVLGASLLVFPGLAEGLDLIRQWLTRSEQFAAYRGVAEAAPMLVVDGRFDGTMGLARLSWFFFAFPIGVAALAVSRRRDPERVVTWSVLFWATGLFLATLLQRRFFNSFSIGLALVTGLALVRMHAECGKGRLAWVPKRVAAAVLLAVGLLATAPMLATYTPYLEAHAARRAGLPVESTPLQQVVRIHHRLADWLRVHTPSPGAWLENEPTPAWGVLAPSDFGHALKYIARRPVVVDNFLDDVGGDGGAFLSTVFAASESEAVPMLDARGVRFVIAPLSRARLGREVDRGGLFDQLATVGRPRAAAAAGITAPPSQLRLRFEHAWTPPGGGRPRPLFRIFERVPGALLVGRAAPGSEVTASLDLTLSHGHTLRVDHTTRAGDDGRWALRVPYSTFGAPASVRPGRHYVVACDGSTVTARVREEDVQTGAEIGIDCESETRPGTG